MKTIIEDLLIIVLGFSIGLGLILLINTYLGSVIGEFYLAAKQITYSANVR